MKLKLKCPKCNQTSKGFNLDFELKFGAFIDSDDETPEETAQERIIEHLMDGDIPTLVENGECECGECGHAGLLSTFRTKGNKNAKKTSKR